MWRRLNNPVSVTRGQSNRDWIIQSTCDVKQPISLHFISRGFARVHESTSPTMYQHCWSLLAQYVYKRLSFCIFKVWIVNFVSCDITLFSSQIYYSEDSTLVLSLCSPWGPWGFKMRVDPPYRPREGPGVKSRMCPPYPQHDRKRRLNGAVLKSPYKNGGPVSVLGRARYKKNPTKCLWRWEPDRRSNFFFSPPAHFFFSPPAHLCAVT